MRLETSFVTTLLLVGCCAASETVRHTLLPDTKIWNATDIAAVQAEIRRGNPSPVLSASLEVAVASADAALGLPLNSVMDKPYTPPNGNKHFYMSLDKYYWPCNAPPPSETVRNDSDCDEKTGLPWQQHDGQTNPAMHLFDHDALVNLTEAVISLGIGYYFSGEEKYARHASDLLTTWFLDEKTAMAPNLEFGHFIPGVSNGSNGAMIDVHHWPVMLDAIALLSESESWTSDKDVALRAWFADFTHWVATSPFGAKESAETNNHGVWYDVLLSGCALYSGNVDLAALIARDAMMKRIDTQITEEGELPAELARTKSFSYTEFCSDAMWQLTAISAVSGIDLTHEKGHGSSRLRAMMDFEMPYVLQQKEWTWQQIVPFFPPNCTITAVDQCIGSFFSVFRRAANGYHSTTYEKVIPKLPGVNVTANVINLVVPAHVTLKSS